MSPKPEAAEKTVASNRRARHDYDIQERFEAGVVLTGSEVKSLRQGRASVAEAHLPAPPVQFKVPVFGSGAG